MKKTKTTMLAKILLLLFLILALLSVIFQYFTSNTFITVSLQIFTFLPLGAGLILSLIAAAKDKEHMKNVEIAKKDERIQNITMRSKAKAFDMISSIFPCIICYLILFNRTNATALLISGALTLFLLITQLYFFHKYSKEN